MCSVNGKFVAVVLEAQGGGAFLVAPLDAVSMTSLCCNACIDHKAFAMPISWKVANFLHSH